MARHILVESLNQQPNPGEDFALTPEKGKKTRVFNLVPGARRCAHHRSMVEQLGAKIIVNLRVEHSRSKMPENAEEKDTSVF